MLPDWALLLEDRSIPRRERIDLLFHRLDDLLLDGQHELANEILEALPLERYEESLRVSVLTVAFWFKSRCPSYSRLYLKVLSSDWGTEVLRGLEP